VRLPAHVQRRDAHLVGRLAQVDQRRRLHAIDPAPHDKHGDIHIRRVIRFDRDGHHRFPAIELAHIGVEDAFALDRDQGRPRAERHAHLQARFLARFIAFLFRQHVDAVIVAGVEPPVAAAGHPRFAVGHGRVAGAILRAGAQHQIAAGGRLHVAHQQALVVRLARARRAQLDHFAAVFIRIEAADQAPAVRIAVALEKVDGHGRIRHGLAIRAQHGHRELEGILAQGPGVGLDADHVVRWPQRHARGDGCRLAICILERHFRHQVTRHGQLRQLVDDDARAARLVQGQALRARGSRAGAGGAATALILPLAFIIVIARALFDETFLHVAIAETIVGIVGKAHALVLQHRAQLDGCVGGSATGQIGDLRIQSQLLCLHGGRLWPLQHGFHGRHAERFHAETTGRAARHGDAVFPLLGVGGNEPVVFRRAAGGPAQGQLIVLVAALVRDDDGGGTARAIVLVHQAHALCRVLADEVLHVHGFAGAQQGAVENRGQQGVVGARVVRGQIETPGFDAAHPVRQGKRHVAAAARTDKVAAIVLAAGIGQLAGDVGHAVRARGALPQQLAGAVAHRHLGFRNRRAFVQRRHPHERRLRAMLEVGRQIRHQRGRADIRGRRLAQQHLAEDGAGQLDHIEARFLQRNADHFKGFLAVRTGQADGARAGGVGQHGLAHVARILGVRLPVLAPVAIAGQALHPLDDELVVIVGHAQGGARGGSRGLRDFLARQHRLDIAHGDGQQAVALGFDDAERGRELEQRRLFARVHRHGKAGAVEQGAARVILQVRRQAQHKTGLHGKRPIESGVLQKFRLFFLF